MTILSQICDTIDNLDNEKIANGDLKLSNILIDSNNNAYLGDFGTSTVV